MVQGNRAIAAGDKAIVRPSITFRSFRLVIGTEEDWTDVPEDAALIVCPWLNGLEPATGPWHAALPIHDCNGFVDSAWTLGAPDRLRERCYVGIFALDRLRSAQQIFGPLREKGISRLINLPSISFFDGATAQSFARFSLNLESEIVFLGQGRNQGFSVALCAPAQASIQASSGFDFILRHRGPGDPMIIDPQ